MLISIPALSLLFLQNRQVQTQLSRHMAERLAENLQVNISVSSVSYSFFRRVQVRELYLEDLHGDTLLYADLAKIRIKHFRPDPKGITFRKATVEGALVNLVIDSSNVVNIKYFTDHLKNPHLPPEMKSRILFEDIRLIDSRFSLSRMEEREGKANINFNDFHVRRVDARVKDLELYQDTVSMKVERLNCQEKNGFDFGEISTMLTIHRHLMHFDGLEIQTPASDLDVPVLWFDFEHFRRFKRFAYEVDLQFESRNSLLNIHELRQFVQFPGEFLNHMSINGKVSGKISDLNGDELLVSVDNGSTLACDFMIIGLPDVKNTFMDFKFKELNTTVEAVNRILMPEAVKGETNLYPWDNLGGLGFTGHFTGYPDQYVATGLLETDLGKVLMNLRFEPDPLRGIDFLGSLRTQNFRLGTLLEQVKNLNQLDMDVNVMGNIYQRHINAELKGRIDTLDYHNYAYSNITLDGAFTNNTFEGGFSISDPNIKMDFEGRTDFSGEVPVHRFKANVARARPYFLNLPQNDPNYFISFLIETDLSGRTLDELNGEIVLVNSLFEKTDAYVQLYDMTLTARNTPDASLLQLRSDYLDADVMGIYQLSSLPSSFRNMADHFLNVIPHAEPYLDTSTYFVYDVQMKRINPILGFFLPLLEVGDNSSFEGSYDPSSLMVDMDGHFPYVAVNNNHFHEVDAYARSDNSRFEAGYVADSLTFGGDFSLHRQELLFAAANDTAYLGLHWDNQGSPNYKGRISMHGQFQDDSVADRGFIARLDAGSFILNDDPWDVLPSDFLIRKAYLKINGLEVNSLEKRILADGIISGDEDQNFHLEVQNLNLASLPRLTGAPMDLAGNLTGFVDYQRVESTPVILTNLEVDSLVFNSQILGHTEVAANWDEAKGNVHITMLSDFQGQHFIESTGEYHPGSQALDFDIRLSQFKISSLEPYVQGLVHDLEGKADVRVTLDGTLQEPELNGTIGIMDGAATFNYLNTRYYTSDQFRIYHNNFYFEDFLVSDGNGQMAHLQGSVSNQHLKDFYLGLNIEADGVQVMNTTSTDNEVFYGTLFGTGHVGITGPTDDISLKISARTEENTALYLPLYNASEVKHNDFITFVMEERPPEEDFVRPTPNSLSLDLEVDITNDAVVQLIFDPQVGDIIETSGNGSLRILLDPDDGFRMFGDVTLAQGDYLFTLQNVINKRFKIEPGGKISFNGSPMDASVDLEAIYTLRAAPYNLYPENDETKEKLKKRIPVECHLILQGELGSPTISTGILLPTADPETRNLLENSTSTDEELMRQFLSLLVINNFYSVSGYGTQDLGTTGNIAGVTASELLSNQLSNWLSQISDDFDIGINYRPGDEVTSDEVEVALSTQLLDDRVIISGNVDVGGQNPSEGDNPNIMGDFDVEFRLTDNISIVAFNRARDELLFETAPYKQGVGISYREEFDTLAQLMNRYKEAIANRKKKKKKADTSGSDD